MAQPPSAPPPAGPPPAGRPPGWDGRQPAPRRSRAVVVAAVVAAVLVLALAIAVPLLLEGDDDSDGGGPAPTLEDVITYEDLRSDHVTEDVEYEMTPPAGGKHFGAWLACGVYDAPVTDEHAVHDLEHGSFWFTYDPELPADDVEALARQLPANGIMSPYEGLPAPVVVTVWEHQLHLEGVDDPRLELFIAKFAETSTAPEPEVGCGRGIPDPSAGPPVGGGTAV